MFTFSIDEVRHAIQIHEEYNFEVEVEAAKVCNKEDLEAMKEALEKDLDDIGFGGASLEALKDLESELESYGDTALVVDDFRDYVECNPDLFCPGLPEEYHKYIDWEMIAHDHCGDYSIITFEGNDYYVGV